MDVVSAWFAGPLSALPIGAKIILVVIFLAIMGFYLWLLRALHRETARIQPLRLGTKRKWLWSKKLY
jgi:hypothetical protein